MISIPPRMTRAQRNDLNPSIGRMMRLTAPVILLDDIVEVLALPNRDRRAVLGAIAFDPRRVGAALVDRDGLRKTIALNGPSEKPLRGSPIALGGEQEVDGVALFSPPRDRDTSIGRRP
jgi:hypothetical protein